MKNRKNVESSNIIKYYDISHYIFFGHF